MRSGPRRSRTKVRRKRRGLRGARARVLPAGNETPGCSEGNLVAGRRHRERRGSRPGPRHTPYTLSGTVGRCQDRTLHALEDAGGTTRRATAPETSSTSSSSRWTAALGTCPLWAPACRTSPALTPRLPRSRKARSPVPRQRAAPRPTALSRPRGTWPAAAVPLRPTCSEGRRFLHHDELDKEQGKCLFDHGGSGG